MSLATVQKMERRSIGGAFELKAEPDGKLRGYAAVFDQWADDGYGGRERVRPGAFRKTLKESPDIRALWNHNTDLVLGRTGNGTLLLREDSHGLAIEIDPPDTQAGRDAVVSVKRGDVSQMSFGFNVIKDAETNDENGNRKRELIELKLHEVSPVTFPFYITTEVRKQRGGNGAPIAAPAPDGDWDAEQLGEEIKPRRRGAPIPTKDTFSLKHYVDQLKVELFQFESNHLLSPVKTNSMRRARESQVAEKKKIIRQAERALRQRDEFEQAAFPKRWRLRKQIEAARGVRRPSAGRSRSAYLKRRMREYLAG